MPVVTTPSTERRACRPTTSTPSSASVTRRHYGPGQGTWVLSRELISWMQVEVKKSLLIIQAHSVRESSRIKCCPLHSFFEYFFIQKCSCPSCSPPLRPTRRPLRGGFAGRDVRAQRFALPPHWHRNLGVPSSPQYRWEVRSLTRVFSFSFTELHVTLFIFFNEDDTH